MAAICRVRLWCVFVQYPFVYIRGLTVRQRNLHHGTLEGNSQEEQRDYFECHFEVRETVAELEDRVKPQVCSLVYSPRNARVTADKLCIQ